MVAANNGPFGRWVLRAMNDVEGVRPTRLSPTMTDSSQRTRGLIQGEDAHHEHRTA